MTDKNKFEGNTNVVSGSQIKTNYGSVEQEAIPVTIEQLEDIRDSSFEEFWQFAAAEFVVAGSLWLAVEKFLDRKDEDPLSPVFWVCLLAVFLGSIVGWAGFRQLKRRKSKIDRIIASYSRD